MVVADHQEWSLRQEQAESSRLTWAFAISLAVHLLFFCGYYTDHRYHWTQAIHLPSWARPIKMLVDILKKKEPPQPQLPPQQEPPLMFVDVSPAQATSEPPKDAKFQSDKNSQAANPEADKDMGAPKITGTQTEIVKTEDVPREKFVPLQPSRPAQPAQLAQEPQEEVKPKAAQQPGDLALAKPEPTPKPDATPKTEDTPPKHVRPRTLAEVQVRPQENRVPGPKMKQDGGSQHTLELASLDAKATPLGAYDAALIDAVRSCWYGLLDAQAYAAEYRGKVMLQFQLHSDGRVTDIEVKENTAGSTPALICQTAIDKPNPYTPFPADLRRAIGETRHIQFTFYYNW